MNQDSSTHRRTSYPLAARLSSGARTVVDIGGVLRIGGGETVVFAGPCAVESAEQIMAAAQAVRAAGAHGLRGGAFKPRTSPYAFRGLGEPALAMLAEARRRTGLPIVTEVLSETHVDLVATWSDVLQIGTRNMSNFSLLEAAARTGKPILLKRGLAATIREWLLAAEYILAQGNMQVILCERGIRGLDAEYTRNTLDLGAVAAVRRETHLPILVDPSHAAGRADLVADLALAAIAAGADGLIVEVHPRPAEARCDGPQSLNPAEFASLMTKLAPLAALLGRPLAPQPPNPVLEARDVAMLVP